MRVLRLLLFALCLFFTSLADARDSSRIGTSSATGCTDVAVTSSSTGTLLVSSIAYAVQIAIVTTSPAVGVWLVKKNTAPTSIGGYYLSGHGNGWDFNPFVDGYYGKIYGILDSGSTAVTVAVCPQ